MEVTITVNGTEYSRDIEPRTLLVHFIREHINLTGTHIGCDTTNCGACTVHVDGTPIKSCTYLAVQANGKSVLTVEGLKQRLAGCWTSSRGSPNAKIASNHTTRTCASCATAARFVAPLQAAFAAPALFALSR